MLLTLGLGALLYRYFVIEYLPTDMKTLWIIDNSLSMAVEDIPASSSGMMMNRLDLAKKLVLSGIEDIRGEHAVMSYARESSMESPFSMDRKFVSNIVASLPIVEFYGGSDLSSALSLTRILYPPSSTPIQVVVLSDGGMTGEMSDIALPSHFDLTFVAIGSERGGKIPLGYDGEGNRRYKYFSGSLVVVPYDPIGLQKMSREYGARFVDQRISTMPLSLVRESGMIKKNKNIFLFLATIFIVGGYFLHPYAKNK